MGVVEVVPHENGWKVVEDGNETGEIYETQERAAEAARSRARDAGAELQVHGSDGTEKGSDPGDIEA